MTQMTIDKLNKLVITIHGRNLADTLEAINIYKSFNTTVPLSIIQEAIEQYNNSLEFCCAAKKQAKADYLALLKAIVDLDTDLKNKKV